MPQFVGLGSLNTGGGELSALLSSGILVHSFSLAFSFAFDS